MWALAIPHIGLNWYGVAHSLQKGVVMHHFLRAKEEERERTSGLIGVIKPQTQRMDFIDLFTVHLDHLFSRTGGRAHM